MSTRALLVGAGALLAVAVVAAQSPETQRPAVTFRVQVDYVEIDAIVTDRQGRFVRDLTKDDFLLIEDGKPQPIAAFTVVDIPVEPRVETDIARLPRTPQQVASNARPFDGRLFMLVLDDLQTDVLRSAAVRERARAFIDSYVGANDLVAVVQTGSIGHNQDFTSDRARLLAAIEGFTGTKRQSAARVILEARQFQAMVPPENRTAATDTEEPYRANDAIRSLSTMKSVSSFLGGIRGRKKALVYVGEGIDYDIKADEVDLSGRTLSIKRDVRAVEEAIDEAIATATRNNVSIYCLDPRGLSTGDDEAIALPGIAMLVPDGKGGKHGTDMLRDALIRSQGSMRTLAEATGGLAFINSNDFGASLSRIVEDSSRHYILGYYAPEGRRDGRYRHVDVRVKRDGLEVR
ncbi:MAG TPA: VWA domain-containing protein, partial [Vicinamibacterales bacterium]